MSAIIKWEYFDFLRFGDPLRLMFDHASQAQKNEYPTFESLDVKECAGFGDEFKGVFPQVLCVENGKSKSMTHFGANIRCFGIRFGYYDPKDTKKLRYIDPIIEIWADLQDALTVLSLSPTV